MYFHLKVRLLYHCLVSFKAPVFKLKFLIDQRFIRHEESQCYVFLCQAWIKNKAGTSIRNVELECVKSWAVLITLKLIKTKRPAPDWLHNVSSLWHAS